MQEAGSDGNGGVPDTGEAGRPDAPESAGSGVDLAVVAGVFTARPGAEGDLLSALARYVVMSRMEPGCRNIDLVASLSARGTLMVWEKWDTHAHRQAHFAGPAAAQLAEAVTDLVAEPPQFDVFEAISAHDLA